MASNFSRSSIQLRPRDRDIMTPNRTGGAPIVHIPRKQTPGDVASITPSAASATLRRIFRFPAWLRCQRLRHGLGFHDHFFRDPFDGNAAIHSGDGYRQTVLLRGVNLDELPPFSAARLTTAPKSRPDLHIATIDTPDAFIDVRKFSTSPTRGVPTARHPIHGRSASY